MFPYGSFIIIYKIGVIYPIILLEINLIINKYYVIIDILTSRNKVSQLLDLCNIEDVILP